MSKPIIQETLYTKVRDLERRSTVVQPPPFEESYPVVLAVDAGTTVNNTTTTKATLDTTTYDTDGIADLAGDQFVVTAPGVYIVTFRATFPVNSTGERRLILRKNTVDYEYDTRAATSVNDCSCGLTTHMLVATGDILEFYYWQNSGGALTCIGSTAMAWTSAG